MPKTDIKDNFKRKLTNQEVISFANKFHGSYPQLLCVAALFAMAEEITSLETKIHRLESRKDAA